MKRRTYSQTCSLAGSLDLVGERWTLLLVRELLTGPKRFKELLPGLEGMGTNLLADRLKFLQDEGIVKSVSHPASPKAKAYVLTEMGLALEPIVLQFVRWGLRYQRPAQGGESYRPEWTAVAMRALFDRQQAPLEPIRCVMEIGDSVLYAVASRDGLSTGLGLIPDPDVVLVATREAFRRIERGEETEDVEKRGGLSFRGDREAFERFRELMRLPVAEEPTADSANRHFEGDAP